MVGDRIDITSAGGTKLATGCVEQVDPIYTQLRSDTGLPVTIPNKVLPHLPEPSAQLMHAAICQPEPT